MITTGGFMENRPFYELCDIVRETKYAKGRWYYPILWFSAVCSVALFALLCLLFLPLFIIILIICFVWERFEK